MAAQIRKQKQHDKQEYDEPQAQAEAHSADLTATDELLDDIDALLDEMLTDQTAQQFVDAFQMRGGQ